MKSMQSVCQPCFSHTSMHTAVCDLLVALCRITSDIKELHSNAILKLCTDNATTSSCSCGHMVCGHPTSHSISVVLMSPARSPVVKLFRSGAVLLMHVSSLDTWQGIVSEEMRQLGSPQLGREEGVLEDNTCPM